MASEEIDYNKVVDIIMFGGDGYYQTRGERLKAFVDQERELAAYTAERPLRDLLTKASERIRHDHAYPMEIGHDRCPGCELKDEIEAALNG